MSLTENSIHDLGYPTGTVEEFPKCSLEFVGATIRRPRAEQWPPLHPQNVDKTIIWGLLLTFATAPIYLLHSLQPHPANR